MKDWNIEQLRELNTAFRNVQEKHVYLNGQPCTVQSISLVQPAFIAQHSGRVLGIDIVDPDGTRHEIRLYTSDWPEERRG